jgi:hypothetical protein
MLLGPRSIAISLESFFAFQSYSAQRWAGPHGAEKKLVPVALMIPFTDQGCLTVEVAADHIRNSQPRAILADQTIWRMI